MPLMVRMMAPAVHEHPVAQRVRPARLLLDDVMVVSIVGPEGRSAQATHALLLSQQRQATPAEGCTR